MSAQHHGSKHSEFLGGTSTLETTQKRIQGNVFTFPLIRIFPLPTRMSSTYINGQTNSVKSTFQSSSLSGKNLHLSLGEFGLTGGKPMITAACSNDGAAFFAAAFKTGLDLGYDFSIRGIGKRGVMNRTLRAFYGTAKRPRRID